MLGFVIWRGPEVISIGASFAVGAFVGWRARRLAERVLPPA